MGRYNGFMELEETIPFQGKYNHWRKRGGGPQGREKKEKGEKIQGKEKTEGRKKKEEKRKKR